MQLRLDRMFVLGALALLTTLGWLYLAMWPMPMPDGTDVTAPRYAALTIIMWFLMMVAMMVPAVTPVVMLFDRVSQQTATRLPRTLSFVGGYLSAWLAFSGAVSLLQIALIRIGWIDAMGVTQHRLVTAALLVAVGIYQWLPLKSACLDHCRSPLQFLTHRYRAGLFGAWRMGLQHGLYCVGCCWLLMLLLFVGGVMNLGWVAGIAILVSIEKLLPQGERVGKLAGLLAVVAGLGLAACGT